MKKLILPTLSIMLAVLFAMMIPTEAEGAIYEDTVRLHILASSDSEEDQALKLAVRDRILEKYGTRLAEAGTKEDALALTQELLPEIESECEAYTSQIGKPTEASATLQVEWFDTRVYENVTLPCGYYCSLVVTLGEGKGKNWWCVMYPPLCLGVSTSRENECLTHEQRELISPSGYKIKFKLLELAAELLR